MNALRLESKRGLYVARDVDEFVGAMRFLMCGRLTKPQEKAFRELWPALAGVTVTPMQWPPVEDGGAK